MIVCWNCSKLGSTYWETPSPPRSIKTPKIRPKTTLKRTNTLTPENLELVDDYNIRVRQAREKLGLSHDDLGKKIGEKISVLRKIESGKMHPDQKLTNKLQHALKITILTPYSEPKMKTQGLSFPHVTLGEVVQLKEKRTEAKKERT
jgi:putative transcription factor